jgi:hypothetical protein
MSWAGHAPSERLASTVLGQKSKRISVLRGARRFVLTVLVIQHSMHAFISKLILPPSLNRFPEHVSAVDKIEAGPKYPNFEIINRELCQALAELK